MERPSLDDYPRRGDKVCGHTRPHPDAEGRGVWRCSLRAGHSGHHYGRLGADRSMWTDEGDDSDVAKPI